MPAFCGESSPPHPSLPPKGEGTDSPPSGGDVRRTEGGIATKSCHTRGSPFVLQAYPKNDKIRNLYLSW